MSNPLDNIDDATLAAAVREALYVEACHVTGTHNPRHTPLYICVEQKRAMVGRLLRELKLSAYDLPRKGDYWTRRYQEQAKSGDQKALLTWGMEEAWLDYWAPADVLRGLDHGPWDYGERERLARRLRKELTIEIPLSTSAGRKAGKYHGPLVGIEMVAHGLLITPRPNLYSVSTFRYWLLVRLTGGVRLVTVDGSYHKADTEAPTSTPLSGAKEIASCIKECVEALKPADTSTS